MRLIYADELAEELSKRVWYEREDEKQAVRIVKEFPTVDAVPVVFCAKCKHTKTDGCGAIYCKKWDRWEMPSDFYCKYGDRKGGADDADS